MTRTLILAALILIVPALSLAESSSQQSRGRAAKESAATRRERERREDLERRIQKLEQQYELQEPRIPDPSKPAARDQER